MELALKALGRVMPARGESVGVGLLAGLATLVLALLITYDVLMRYFLNQPQLFVDEIGGFLQVLVIFGGAAYTFRVGGHVRVDLVTSHRAAGDAGVAAASLTSLLGLVFLAMVIWVTTQSALTAYRYGRVSAVHALPAVAADGCSFPPASPLMALVMVGTLGRQLRRRARSAAARDEVPPDDGPRERGRSSARSSSRCCSSSSRWAWRSPSRWASSGVLGLLYLKGWTVGLGVVGSIAWSNASSFSFVAVPLFVFMSGILLHSGIGKGSTRRWRAGSASSPAGSRWPASSPARSSRAVSGSSVATAATIGMIAIPGDGAAGVRAAASSSARSPPAGRSASSSRPRCP